jgi:hypothetical protein
MRRLLVLLGLVAVIGAPVLAQRWYGQRLPRTLAYDGRFVFVRLWYADYPGWSYDWPETEENLGKLLPQITAIRSHPGNGNIFRMDDPELLKYPVAYLSEPGYWFPSESEVLGLRRYLEKGGFLIVDDFHFENEWAVFERAMRRVLPAGRIERLDVTHPVFNSFFQIKTLDVPYPGRLGEMGLKGEFFGIHEDSHPSRRLMVVINYNMDIGDYMEWSATGLYAVDPTNEAYKFCINYLIYGLTH